MSKPDDFLDRWAAEHPEIMATMQPRRTGPPLTLGPVLTPLTAEEEADARALVAMASHVYAATGRPATLLHVPPALVFRMRRAAEVAEMDVAIVPNHADMID